MVTDAIQYLHTFLYTCTLTCQVIVMKDCQLIAYSKTLSATTMLYMQYTIMYTEVSLPPLLGL